METFKLSQLSGRCQFVQDILVMRLSECLFSGIDFSAPHRHDFFQIVFFERGGGEHVIDFTRYEVRAHHVFYLAPEQISQWRLDVGTEGYVLNFHESFFTAICHNPNFVRLFPLFNHLSQAPVNHLDMSCCSELEPAFAQLLTEFEGVSDFRYEMMRGLLLTILVRLSRAVTTGEHFSTSKSGLLLVRRYEILISEHYKEFRLPREYAALLFVTPNHLNATVSMVLGRSAGDLIRERVVLEAKRLLINSDLLVSQIADLLNFDDNAYFSRYFRKYTGHTPESFRVNFLNGRLELPVHPQHLPPSGI